MKQTYSLHKITAIDDFGFNPAEYSRFKFGDGTVARAFGTALAKGFIEKHLMNEYVKQQFVVISSPYAFVPTATFAMKNYFVFELNHWLAENDFPVIQEAKVHRTITYKEDYGNLDAAKRLSLIANDSFHIDKDFLKNKSLIFLDDIRITGSHEKMIIKMLDEYQLTNDLFLLYYAELVNKDIPPNIENTLNYFKVKSIFDLDDIIKGEKFYINTRIVKYILNCDFVSFSVFIKDQTHSFIQNLYHMAIGNGYHTFDNYSRNLNYIKEYLFVNKPKFIVDGN